jgi:integration host factor subunit beta
LPSDDCRNKAELVKSFGKESRLSRTRAKQVADVFFYEMSTTFAKDDRVEIRGLCNIYVKHCRECQGRNPEKGSPEYVPAQKLPFFKCGKELKESKRHTNPI